MPSRAVLRKKARRESRRRKEETTKATVQAVKAAVERRVGQTKSSGDPHASPVITVKKPKKTVRGESAPQDTSENRGTNSTASVATPSGLKRPRTDEGRAAVERMPEGLTHKERKKWLAKQRLEKQIRRLNVTASTRPVAAPASGEGVERSGEAGAAAPTGDPAATPEVGEDPKLRHDPRFINGTFWRTRKERRARTLFLGGIPSTFSVRQIKDFVHTMLDADVHAAEYLEKLEDGQEAVESVDLLPVKPHAKIRHMYIVLASVPLAGCAAARLDGHALEGRQLRCNFAADKSQREEAIRRRSGGSGGAGGFRQGGFRG